MSTHNIGFYEEISKIIFKLSSNTYIDSVIGNGGNFILLSFDCTIASW